MLEYIKRHINSFDFFRALVVSVCIIVPFYWGFQNNQFQIAFVCIVGVMFAYFPNIEGTNKHRLFGMFISLILGILTLFIVLFSYQWSLGLRLITYSILIFCVSIICVFGYRGSMISFAGLFAVVMGFAISKFDLSYIHIFTYSLFSGLVYLLISGISQYFFENKHIEILLFESVELTADYLEINEKIKWNLNEKTPNLQQSLLNIQSNLNDKHELLRTLLMSKTNKLISSNKTRKYFLIFSELINIYELAIANDFEFDEFEEQLGINNISAINPLREANILFIDNLRKFGYSIRNRRKYEVSTYFNELFVNAEARIQDYIEVKKLPFAREGALLLRNLLDHEVNQFQRLQILQRVNSELIDSETLISPKISEFISNQDYSFKQIKANLTLESSIFRHSLRLTFSVLLCIVLGEIIDQDQTNWIIVTVIVILRPNYGLTKSRAVSRILGTFIGAIITFFLIVFSKNPVVYGLIASISLVLGFSFIQKNYKWATAFITISILLLYIINEHDTIELIELRAFYTFLGVIISIISMSVLWPIWENEGIHVIIKKAIQANLNYLKAVNSIYHEELDFGPDYKLIRKEAFLKNGNLNAAFQRISEEPNSRQIKLSNIYAIVLLNQTLLSAIASFSTYIQAHKTTKASLQFELLLNRIFENLSNACLILEGIEQIHNIEDFEVNEALEILELKYQELNTIRNLEIESGIASMSVEMRERILEGKVILDQIKWFNSLSENILDTASNV